ncbi:MAG: thioesterase family protein [Hyphomicrobiaceae bacterium]
MTATRPPVGRREDYRHFLSMPTRWMDNDGYGHLNNVVYYSFFDTLLTRYLIDHAGMELETSPVIGLAVETTCRFHRSFAFPETIEGGLRIGRLGRSSARYEIGLFGAGDDTARAEGHFIHVYVDRLSQRPVEIPADIRAALQQITV